MNSSITVIHTKGSNREIGRQHGEQLREQAVQGMPRFYHDFWKRVLSESPEEFLRKTFFKMGRYLIDPGLVGILYRQVPSDMRDRVVGLAEVTGIDGRMLATALVLPDLMPLLQSALVKFFPKRFVLARPPLAFGCSSFIWKASDIFLHGRNLDFPGVGYWDRYPVVQRIEVDGKIPYIAFTTAGVPFGGITGINEEQISVSLHQHYCSQFSLTGQLPFLLAEKILSHSKRLTDALDLLSDAPLANAWAFVMTDGKTQDGVIVECLPRVRGVRHLEETNPLTHSNYFQTLECRRAEYAASERMNWDNCWRRHRLESLLLSCSGPLTSEKAISFLSDHFDGYWGVEKILNRTIAQAYNIQSLLLDPVNLKAWMAEGESPIQIRSYREIDLAAVFDGKTGLGSQVPGYRFSNQNIQRAKESYIQSFIAAFDGRLSDAEKFAAESLNHDYCPEVAYVLALVLLKLKNYQRACELLEEAKGWIENMKKEKGKPVFPPEYFEICLYLGRTYYLLGRREEAQNIYAYLQRHPDLLDENIRRIASSERDYTPARVSRLIMPYSSYIPFE